MNTETGLELAYEGTKIITGAGLTCIELLVHDRLIRARS